MTRKFTAAQLIDAIEGSGGILSTVARRLGCDWHTAETYIQNDATVKAAFDAELASLLDLCEAVLFRNVQLAHEAQANGYSVDTSDAKWILSRLDKDRGYATGQ